MDSPPRQRWFQRHPKKAIVIILVVLTLILDFTLTGVYHVIKYGSIHKHAGRTTIGEPSPVFHHALKPNVEISYERWGHRTHSVSTNSLGFRDKAVREVPLSSDSYRLLFMGDSFTQGVGFDYEKTFVGLVEAALAKDDIEVLNAAVVSYSPAIYFKKTEYLLSSVGLRFDQMVVFLDISDIQDEAEWYDIRDGRVVWIRGPDPVIKEFFLTYTALIGNLVRLGSKLDAIMTDDPDLRRSKEERSYAINDYRGLWTIDDSAYSDYGEIGLPKAQERMDLLHDLLQRHGIGMTLVVYPWPDQILHVDADSLQVRVWRAWARRHAVPFINLFPDFIRNGQDPKQAIRQYFIPGDVHWNEEGHRLVAARFLEGWERPHPTQSQTRASGHRTPS